MAKPTTYATPICIGLSIVAAIGLIIGLKTTNPLWIAFFLLPTVIYEIYRTEGNSTRWSSLMLLAVLILEIIFIIFKINYDLGAYLGQSGTYVGGQFVPLGDIKVLAPALLAVLSLILFTRTAGIYTKWLSVIIIIASFGLIFTLSQTAFSDLLRQTIQNAFYYI
ncbi:MAG: hypothetical protein PHW50_02325 [Patescibacteria group bacterium]|nr:hypothetical protein [Patescibacteria group bacterium]